MKYPLDGTEEYAFKCVEDGWIYRASSYWPFGASGSYPFNEEQKQVTTRFHRTMQRDLFVAMMVPIIIAVVGL